MTHPTLEQLPSPREFSDISQEEFRDLARNSYEPLVVRGLARDWEIVKAAGESSQAAADYLRKFDTGRALPVVVAPFETGGRMAYNDDHTGFNFTREKSTLSAGLDRLLARSSDAGDPFMFFQCVPVSASAPGLESELHNPLVPDSSKPHIWIGSRITVAAHFDEAKNVAIVAAGQRRFTLFPPEQVENLYVGRLDFTPAGQPISLVDLRAPDFEKYPKYRHALESALSVELAPGDAIYMPAPWWHHVESQDRLNVLVNFWWDGAYAASGLPFTALIHAIQAFRHLPADERQAWKDLVDHYVFESHGDPAAHLAPHDPGILGAMSPSLAKHIDRWLAQQIGPPKK
ncbi:MAG: cupin-like domain-containing protein [Woeseiaceae bacterium]